MTMREEDREPAAFVCSHIFRDTTAVLLVAHDGGDWMFLCGAEHGPDEDYHVVGVDHLMSRDPSIREVMDLPESFEAERTAVGTPWVRVPTTVGQH